MRCGLSPRSPLPSLPLRTAPARSALLGLAWGVACPALAQEEAEATWVIEARPEVGPTESLDPTATPATDLADVLDRAAGVQIRRLGGPGAWSGVSIRGQSMRQTTVLLDGIPLNPDGGAAVGHCCRICCGCC